MCVEDREKVVGWRTAPARGRMVGRIFRTNLMKVPCTTTIVWVGRHNNCRTYKGPDKWKGGSWLDVPATTQSHQPNSLPPLLLVSLFRLPIYCPSSSTPPSLISLSDQEKAKSQSLRPSKASKAIVSMEPHGQESGERRIKELPGIIHVEPLLSRPVAFPLL